MTSLATRWRLKTIQRFDRLRLRRLRDRHPGVVLDPEQAREELEPYSRMAGGIAKDALDEAGLDLGSKSDAESASGKEPVVMLRCTSCKKLNEEDSKFCQECGAPI